MKKFWLKLRLLFTFSKGRRRALRHKYFVGGGLNPAAEKSAGNRVLLRGPDGVEREVKDWYVRGALICITGKNNTIIFDGEHDFNDAIFSLVGDGGYVYVGPSKGPIGSCEAFLQDGGKLIIGKNFSCRKNNLFWVGRGTIEIGDDCMFSLDVRLRAEDGHPILDRDGKKTAPEMGHLKLGNHVWAGEGAYFLKNAEVGDNSVVGARTVVVKKYPQGNVILGGNPARVIRTLDGGTWKE